jgi:hypothetical protein
VACHTENDEFGVQTSVCLFLGFSTERSSLLEFPFGNEDEKGKLEV